MTPWRPPAPVVVAVSYGPEAPRPEPWKRPLRPRTVGQRVSDARAWVSLGLLTVGVAALAAVWRVGREGGRGVNVDPPARP